MQHYQPYPEITEDGGLSNETGGNAPSFETQCTMILAHLKTGKSITGLEALHNFGCIHLPRRILDLKERGISIADQWIKLPNGKRCKEYWLNG